MAVKITRRRFSLEAAQRAQSMIEAQVAAGGTMSMAEALRRADGDEAGADRVRHELEQEKP